MRKVSAGIYLWIDIFSVNQHAASAGALPESFWETTFQEMIDSIGRTIVVLDQLDRVPTPLTRIWCIWEIYCTVAK